MAIAAYSLRSRRLFRTIFSRPMALGVSAYDRVGGK